MKIYTSEYNLECFKSKDIYTWNEIIEILEDYEQEIYCLREELEQMNQKKEQDEHDIYIDSLLERGEI